jgi:hypothetical protein
MSPLKGFLFLELFSTKMLPLWGKKGNAQLGFYYETIERVVLFSVGQKTYKHNHKTKGKVQWNWITTLQMCVLFTDSVGAKFRNRK